jgi:hypothetical protein
MQRKPFLGQTFCQRRFNRACDAGFPLIPVKRTKQRHQIALGSADLADAMDIEDPFRH